MPPNLISPEKCSELCENYLEIKITCIPGCNKLWLTRVLGHILGFEF